MSFYSDASLTMIPSGYKDQKVYSVTPTDGSGDLTFSRASDATRVNSSGLVEKVRTNLVKYSNDFSNVAWVNSGITLTSGQEDPFGGTTGWRYVMTVIGGSYIYQDNITINGVEMTLSFWVKSNTGSDQSFRATANSGAQASQFFTATTSWQRVSWTFTSSAGNGNLLLAYSPTTNCDLLIYGAQFETGVMTDYIATTTTAVSVGPVSGLPRLDYSGGASCPSLLLEGQRTNINLWSESFDNAAYTKTSIVVTANATTSPDGYQNADLFTTNDLSGTVYRVYQNSIGGSDITNTISAFFKYGNHPYAYMTGDSAGLGKYAIFDIQNGTNTFVSSGYSATITPYSNGWYRCTLTGTIDSANNIQFGLAPTTTAYSGTSLANGKTLYCWGAMREYNAAYATSYIPTLSSAVTRVVDFGSSSDTLGTSYSSSDFSYFIEFDLLQDSGASNSPMLFGGGNQALGASYQGYLRIGLNGNNSMILFGHGDSEMASVIYPFTKGTRYKLLVKRSGTSIKFYVNGAQAGATGTSSLDFTLRSIGWSYSAGSYNTYGNIHQFLAFESALSDADAITLTTL